MNKDDDKLFWRATRAVEANRAARWEELRHALTHAMNQYVAVTEHLPEQFHDDLFADVSYAHVHAHRCFVEVLGELERSAMRVLEHGVERANAALAVLRDDLRARHPGAVLRELIALRPDALPRVGRVAFDARIPSLLDALCTSMLRGEVRSVNCVYREARRRYAVEVLAHYQHCLHTAGHCVFPDFVYDMLGTPYLSAIEGCKRRLRTSKVKGVG